MCFMRKLNCIKDAQFLVYKLAGFPVVLANLSFVRKFYEPRGN